MTVDVASGTAGTPTPLIATSAWEGNPAWSPDGSKIAFQRSIGGNDSAIFIRDIVNDPNGFNEIGPIAAVPGFNGWPSWSPDGSRIAFSAPASSSNSAAEIYVAINFTTGEFSVSRLTNIPKSSEGMPTWSPDGKAFAIHSEQSRQKRGIYRLDLATGAFTLLTPSSLNARSPDWSP